MSIHYCSTSWILSFKDSTHYSVQNIYILFLPLRKLGKSEDKSDWCDTVTLHCTISPFKIINKWYLSDYLSIWNSEMVWWWICSLHYTGTALHTHLYILQCIIAMPSSVCKVRYFGQMSYQFTLSYVLFWMHSISWYLRQSGNLCLSYFNLKLVF